MILWMMQRECYLLKITKFVNGRTRICICTWMTESRFIAVPYRPVVHEKGDDSYHLTVAPITRSSLSFLMFLEKAKECQKQQGLMDTS